MKVSVFTPLSLIVAIVLAWSGVGITQGPRSLPASLPQMGEEPVVRTESNPAQVMAALRSSPLMFIENVGQFDERARFQVRGATGGTMWLAEDAIWVTVLEPADKETGGQGDKEMVTLSPPHLVSPFPQRGVNLKLSFVGANSTPRIEPFNRLDTHVSYFIGSDPAKWHPDVPVWDGVRYKDLYPGIDLELTSERGRLVQRIVARHGANLNAVRLRVEGADALSLDGGRLRLTTAVGEFTLPLLQVTNADIAPRALPTLIGDQVISPFASTLPNPQSQTLHTQSLANDPSDLLYSTFLGGSYQDWSIGIAVDGSRAAYVTGMTYSFGFPSTSGAFDSSHSGSGDAFVVKLNDTGMNMAYATFLGGSSWDAGYDIAVDGSGSAYVSGGTHSYDFPTTLGAFDRSYNGGGDTSVVKLNATGSTLIYSTFLGGYDEDSWSPSIAVDRSRAAYVTGRTFSSNFPITSGAFDRTFNGGTCDAFVVKLNATGSTLAYATFLGGNAEEWGFDIAVDGSGAAYITGDTSSYNFPTTAGSLDGSYNGVSDAFVVKLSNTGASLVYATFLGGSSWERGHSIDVDGSGTAYISGYTSSFNFPTTSGAFDTSYNGYGDGFVAKLNPGGSTLIYATFLGGTWRDESVSIDVNSSGHAYVVGITTSENFPTTPRAFDVTHNGARDVFIAKLDRLGNALQYATFLGGAQDDGEWDESGSSYYALGIVADNGGASYVTGITFSSDFPTTAAVFDTSYNSGGDAFVAKLATGDGPSNIWSYQTDTSPTIDGDLGDWVIGASLSLNAETAEGLFGPSIPHDANDLSADLRSLWDANNLYLAVRVRDDVLVADSEALSDDDCVVLGIDGVFDHSPGGGDDHEYDIGWDGRMTDFGAPTSAIQGAAQVTPEGYVVEIAIPLSELGGSPLQHGRIIGLALGLRDDDDGGSRDSFLVRDGDHTDDSSAEYGRLHLLGTTLTFQHKANEYTLTQDTYISAWCPTVNYNSGSDAELLHLRSRDVMAALLYFNLAPLDGNLVIDEATLTVYATWRSNANPMTVSSYRLLRAWDPDEATWLQASAQEQWGEPGANHTEADRLDTPSDMVEFNGVGYYDFDVTDMVQVWHANPDDNKGVIPKTGPGDWVEYMLGAAENQRQDWRPRLTVRYHLPQPEPTTHSISGRVTDTNSNPIVSVTISAGGGISTTTTDGNGDYTLSGLAAGTCTITPSKSGYTFSPASRTVSVPPDATGQDFTGTLQTYSISGRVTDGGGNPISDVTISDGEGHTATTHSEGNYTLSGLAAGIHTIRPLKSGYTFSPASRTVSVPPDATGQDFTGVLQTYSISGQLADGSGNPISGATISDGAGHTATTDSNGDYTLSGLEAGIYTITPSKSGYTFSPASRTVSVPPDATGRDFTGSSGPGPTPGLVYVGPRYLPDTSVITEEVDSRITMGDHVHLQLPFRNTGNVPVSNAIVQVTGAPEAGSSAGVSIYNGVSWLDHQQSVALTPSTIGPGETGIADFWIYVTNKDPIERDSIRGSTWLEVCSGHGQWKIWIGLAPITSDISGNEDLRDGSCLHHPDNFEIQKYAQYAAGAWMRAARGTNIIDPDTLEQAVRNLVWRVSREFEYKEGVWNQRVPDILLLTRRDGHIGVCTHYADLTTGLLRSLGIPSRYIVATLSTRGWDPMDWWYGHAWVEAYLSRDGWRQADPTSGVAFDEGIHERTGSTVKEAWADRYPLSSASMRFRREYRCISPCYQDPVDCNRCLSESNRVRWPFRPDLSCVEDVTARYHNVGSGGMVLAASEGEQILLSIQAPAFVTRTIPFTVTASVVNSTTQTLDVITATLSLYEHISSTMPLYDIAPAYHTISDLAPGGAVIVTWTVKPLVVGSGLPLRVAAFSGDLFGFDEWPLVVNEPGTAPPLTLGGFCRPGTVQPGRPFTLTVYVLDETLQSLTDTLTAITATLYATPTLGYSDTVPLTLDADGFFRGVLTLPITVPIGTYQVDVTATRPGYHVAHGVSSFFVAPPLMMTLEVTPTAVVASQPMTLTVRVYERGTVVTEAGAWAEVATSGGVVTMPLVYSGGVYTATFRPADLAPNLGGSVRGGEWQIVATADYYGSTSTAAGAVTVFRQVYLPLIIRNR